MEASKRSIILRLPRGVSDNITRSSILQALYVIAKTDINEVEYISQQYNNYTWRITFKKDFSIAKLIGEKVRFSGVDVELEDFSEFSNFRFSSYKVMWLPHEFPTSQISDFFKKNGDISSVSIIEEVTSLNLDDLSEIKVKTGNLLVKIKQKKDSKDLPVTGIHMIQSFKCFVHKLGEKPKCLRCNETGHIRKKCPKNSIFCIKCKKIGHVISNCNMALATTNQIVEAPDEHDDTHEDLTGLEDTSIKDNYSSSINNENITPAKIKTLYNNINSELEVLETKKRKKQDGKETSTSESSPISKNPKNLENQEQISQSNEINHINVENGHIPIEEISIDSASSEV